jgi:RNA polymerase sigma factor (sigma-70 family)
MTKSLFEYSDQGRKDAEDLFQEAWRQAFEKIDRYNLLRGKSFGTWVKGIADNLFLEGNRRDKKRKKAHSESLYLMDKDDEGEPLDDSPNAEQLAISEPELEQGKFFRKEDLMSALNILTPTEREILTEWLRTYDKNDPGKEEHVRNLARLAEKFSVQTESLRKIKQRAVEKIQRHFDNPNFKR